MRRAGTALTAVALVVAACAGPPATAPDRSAPRSSSGGGPVAGTVTVAVAASLTEPFTAIGEHVRRRHPEVEVRFTFDSSSTLRTQIEQGAPADVFASADEANLRPLQAAGLVQGEPRTFARNRLAIAVKAGNPRGVRGLADLPSLGTVALCGRDVPCGRYAEELLARAGVALAAEHTTRGQNAKATLGAVANGDADAAVVYRTDITGSAVEAVELPDAQNVVVTYPIAVLAGERAPAAASAFVEEVLGPDGQAELQRAGFLPP